MRQKFWAASSFAGKVQKNRRGFSGRFKEARREIEIPPGSFSFGEAKENAEGQSETSNMSDCIRKVLKSPTKKHPRFSAEALLRSGL